MEGKSFASVNIKEKNKSENFFKLFNLFDMNIVFSTFVKTFFACKKLSQGKIFLNNLSLNRIDVNAN